VKRILASTAVIGLAIAGMGTSSAAPAVFKVTGGGQLIDLSTESGAGDTIAFSAQSQGSEGEAAKGQFQYVDRTGGTGQAQEVIHGTVSCVVVYSSGDGGTAVIGGESRTGEPFRIDVTDNGQGGTEDDMVSVRRGDEAFDGSDLLDGQPGATTDTALCDMENEDANRQLGRGNVTIHQAKS
jgi:hypothetical protein